MNYLTTLPDRAISLGIRIVIVAVLFLLGLQLIKLFRKILRKSLQKAKVEIGAIQFLDSFVKITLIILLAFALATYCGVEPASIVAILGSLGVAIGLAVQGSLSNMAGGILLLVVKPFKVGDYICESSSSKEGIVTEINVFYTKLTTPDGKEVILPNGSLANHTIVNVTSTRERRLDLKVGVSYSSDLQKAKAVLTGVLMMDEKVISEKERFVAVEELGDSSVVLLLRCWVFNEDYWEAKWRLTERCKTALDEAKIEIAFPQLDVHMIS